MTDQDRAGTGGRPQWLTPRTVVGAVLAVLLVLFVVLNRDSTSVSFVVFETDTPLWVALTVAGVVGAAVGFLLGRRFYRR